MKKRILLVDDELDLAEVTINRLTASNYDVTHMPDGEQALRWLEGNAPHLILLDLLLPGKQGGDICKALRKNVKFKNVPVILFTASASDLEKLVKEYGADDYILKPFESEDLIAKVKKFIG